MSKSSRAVDKKLQVNNYLIIVANAPISDFVPEVLIQDKVDKTKKNRVAAFNMVNKNKFQ